MKTVAALLVALISVACSSGCGLVVDFDRSLLVEPGLGGQGGDAGTGGVGGDAGAGGAAGAGGNAGAGGQP